MSRALPTAILLTIVLAFVPATRAVDRHTPPPLLAEVRDDLAAGLRDIHRAAEAAADAVRLATGGEDEVRQILGLVATHDPAVVDCGWIDPDGVLRWIEPADWRAREGANLSDEEIVRRLVRSRQPVLGRIERSAEEIDASALTYPVITSNGRLAGAVRILFRPETLADEIVQKHAVESDWDVWVLETDGKILFASDPAAAGRSLLSDDGFRSSPELIEIGRRMQTEPEGEEAPPGGNPDDSARSWREGHWTSVVLDGTEWRVLVTRSARRS
jgi:hypothetical protein